LCESGKLLADTFKPIEQLVRDVSVRSHGDHLGKLIQNDTKLSVLQDVLEPSRVVGFVLDLAARESNEDARRVLVHIRWRRVIVHEVDSMNHLGPEHDNVMKCVQGLVMDEKNG
jgi:hypothetical protein